MAGDSTAANTLLGADTRAGVDTLGSGPAPPVSDAVPDRVGRFVVLDRLGAGGMGVVYAAYDPDLDRRLALKFLLDASSSDHTAARLRREAKALARLSHPNVAQVYDVGEVGRRVFLAMEFVHGQSLRAWLAAASRSVPDVLDAFVAAGQGLEAAHRAGLVHRDFKPDNVMVGADGRVVVLDFGIAHAMESHPSGDTDAGGNQLDADENATSMVGTPRYMAPEQFGRAATDARTDQFAFCVALWEALYGSHPFAPADATAMVLATHVLDGVIRPPDARRAVPVRVQRALRRGLHADPGQRFTSMGALLDVLRRDRNARVRRLGWTTVVAAMVGTATWVATANRPDPCEGSEARLDGVWDDARRTQLLAHFDTLGVAYAREASSRVHTLLDDYSSQWLAMHREACEATHLRHEQSDTLLDARMQCLDRRRTSLRARVTVLSEATADTLPQAVETAADLPSLNPCSDLARLRKPVRPVPEGAEAAAQSVQTTLEMAKAARTAGQLERARQHSRDALEAATRLDYDPLVAAAQLSVATLLADDGKARDAEEAATEAFHTALGSRDDEVAFEAAVFLLENLGGQQRNTEDGLEWAALADSLLRREHNPTAREAQLQYTRGSVLWQAERLDEAHVALGRAMELTDDTNLRMQIQVVLGAVLYSAGNLDDARDTLTAAVHTMEETLGPNHPRITTALNNAGAVAFARGDFEAAEDAFERVAQIVGETYGEAHPSVASALNNLAVVYNQRRDLEKAREMNTRVLEIYAQIHPDDHPEVARVHSNLGWVFLGLDAHNEALRSFERAAVILETRALDTTTALEGIGETLIAMGDADAGLAKLQSVVDRRTRTLGAAHPQLAEALHRLGDAHVRLGRATQGVPLLERAREIRKEALPTTHTDQGFTLSLLVRGYADLGRHDDALEAARAFDALPDVAKGSPRRRNRVEFDRTRIGDPTEARRRLTSLRGTLADDDPLRRQVDAWLVSSL